MIEVEEDVGELKGLIEGDGNIVPLAVKDEVGAGKLGIVVTCKRMVSSSLDLNVSVSLELITLKVGEGVTTVAGAKVLIYSTVDLVGEGEAGNLRTGLFLVVDLYSELRELLGLVAYPRSSLGEVYAGNLFAVLVSLYEYGSTVSAVVSLGLIPLLNLVGNNSLKNSACNVFLSDLFGVEGLNIGNEVACYATEYDIVKLDTGVESVGPTVDVYGSYVVRVDSHRAAEGLNVCAVDVVVKSDLVVIGKSDNDVNLEPLGPTVSYGNSCDMSACADAALKNDTARRVTANLKHLKLTGAPTGPVSVASCLSKGDVEGGGYVSLHLEGEKTNRVVSAGEAGKTQASAVVRNPEHVLCAEAVVPSPLAYSCACSETFAALRHRLLGVEDCLVYAVNLVKRHVTILGIVEVLVTVEGYGVINYIVSVTNGTSELVAVGNESVSVCVGVSAAAKATGGCAGNCELVTELGTFPTARALSYGLAGSGRGLVNVTVKSVVTLNSVTEVEVVELNAGVGNVGPTGDLESLDLLGVKSSVVAGVVKVSGVSAKESTVDVVVNVKVTGILHLDNDHNVEPLGPAVSCGNGDEVKVGTVKTTLKDYAGLLILFNSEDVDGVVVPGTTVVPVGSVSGLTNGEGERGIEVGMTCKAGGHAEGDNAYCIVLAGEVAEGCLATVVGRHPHLELTACITLTVVLEPTVLRLVAGSGEVGSSIGSRIEDVLVLASLIYIKLNSTVGNVLVSGVGAVTVPVKELVLKSEYGTACAGVSKGISVLYVEVVLVSGVTEYNVVKLVTGACCLVVGVDVNSLDSIGVSSKSYRVGSNVVAVDVVGSDNLIGLRIKSDLDSYVDPTGVAVLVYCNLSKLVLEALNGCVTVRCGRDSEYGSCDSPRISPTNALSGAVAVNVEVINSVINESHLEVVVDVSAYLEGEVTNGVGCCGEAGELVGAAVCGRHPDLNLLSSARLYVSSYELEVAVSLCGIVCTVSGVNVVVSSCVTVETVVVGTVGVVVYVEGEAVITDSTGVSRSCVCVGNYEIVCVGVNVTGGLTANGTSLSLCTGLCSVVVSDGVLKYLSAVVATSTGYVRVPTLFSTGRSLSVVRNLIVTEHSVNDVLLSGELVAADCAVNNAVVLTVCGTSGSSYVLVNCCGSGVTGSGDGLGSGDVVAANKTLNAIGKTGVVTVGSVAGNYLGSALVLTSKVYLTVVTYEVRVLVLVTGSGDRLLSESGGATNGTYGTVGETGLSTGCCVTGNNYVGVTESCIGNSVSGKLLVTGCTVYNLVVRAGKYASRKIYVLVYCIGCGVTESLALNKTTCGAVLSCGTGCVNPRVLVLVEEPLGVGCITHIEVIKRETGAGACITADVSTVDVEILDSHTNIIEASGAISGVYVAELAVDVVADAKYTVGAELHEHLNVNPLVCVNSSEGVGGHGVTVYSVGTVELIALEVRHECKYVNGVTAPCAVSIPVGIVSSGHNDDTNSLILESYVHLDLEGKCAKRIVLSVEAGERISVVLIVGGEVEHVLSSISTGNNVILSIVLLKSDIAVLREVNVLVTVVDELLLSGEGVHTSGTAVCKNAVYIRSHGSMVSYGLTNGKTTAVKTHGGLVTGSLGHIVTKSLTLGVTALRTDCGGITGSVYHAMCSGKQNVESVSNKDQLCIKPAAATNFTGVVLNVTGSVASRSNRVNLVCYVSSVLVSELATVHTMSVAGVEVLVLCHGNDYGESVKGSAGALCVVPSGTTIVTYVVSDVTVSGTGRSYSLNVGEGVSCIGIGELIADHTVSITGVEVLVASENNNVHGVGVVNEVSVEPVTVTDGTYVVLYVTISGTSSINCIYLSNVVSCCGIGELATYVTVSVTLEEISVSGSDLYRLLIERHTGALCIVPAVTADLTVVVLNVTVLGTGCIYCRNVYYGVSSILVGKLVANLTVRVTRVVVLVTVSFAVSCLTYGTGLGGFTISLRPAVSESKAGGLATRLTGLGSSTGSVSIVVTSCLAVSCLTYCTGLGGGACCFGPGMAESLAFGLAALTSLGGLTSSIGPYMLMSIHTDHFLNGIGEIVTRCKSEQKDQ